MFDEVIKEKKTSKVDESFLTGFEYWEAGSGNTDSETSSHMFKPKWKRLVKSASISLSERIVSLACSQTDPSGNSLCEAFTHRDAGGGGTTEDVTRLWEKCIEQMDMDDKDSGFVLLVSFQILKADDLPINSLTWRALLVTS